MSFAFCYSKNKEGWITCYLKILYQLDNSSRSDDHIGYVKLYRIKKKAVWFVWSHCIGLRGIMKTHTKLQAQQSVSGWGLNWAPLIFESNELSLETICSVWKQ